jgi:hypothetical protein
MKGACRDVGDPGRIDLSLIHTAPELQHPHRSCAVEKAPTKAESGRNNGLEAAFRPPFRRSSEGLHVLGLPALRSLRYVELNRLAFLQRAKSIALYRGEVDENVLAVWPAQKSEALGVVKPLHCSLFHFSFFLWIECIAELKVGLIASQAMPGTGKKNQVGFDDESLLYHAGAAAVLEDREYYGRNRHELGETNQPEYAEYRVRARFVLSLELLARPR